jgi:hypothetical protein
MSKITTEHLARGAYVTPLFETLKGSPRLWDVTSEESGTTYGLVGAENLRPPTANVPAKRSEVGLV